MDSDTEFWEYAGRPYRLERSNHPDAVRERVGFFVDRRTGEFIEDNSPISDIIWPDPSTDGFWREHDSFRRDKHWYVDAVEHERMEYLRGDGAVFALYEVIEATRDQARTRGRMTPEERALVLSTTSRTFQLWEEEIARRTAGEAPTFEVTSTVGYP
ncbi:hypothetical protein ACFXHA_27295 [Nocardia sp. NPDC059240]|uniref:hypothetical protein n=1 Tax=Nocardia sp. NPDC059240 TaxID=3346786 RepID=UPI0036950CB9